MATISSSDTIKKELEPKPLAPGEDSPLTSESFRSSALVDSMISELQKATIQASADDKTNAGSTAVHFVWPVDGIDTSSKEQGDRLIEAIRGVTDKPEEIHNCLLGETLVFAKASMTAAQAAILQDHPDESFCTSLRGNSN